MYYGPQKLSLTYFLLIGNLKFLGKFLLYTIKILYKKYFYYLYDDLTPVIKFVVVSK